MLYVLQFMDMNSWIESYQLVVHHGVMHSCSLILQYFTPQKHTDAA
jgi:hypothetical protein